MPLGTEVGLGPGDIVLDGDPAPPPQFSAHVYCGQTAGWIKMPLGTEVGLGPGDIVLDGDPAPPPQFSAHVYCGQTAGWIKMALGNTGHIALDGDPSPLPKMGRRPQFLAQFDVPLSQGSWVPV